jgi:uncharacterized protein YcnI
MQFKNITISTILAASVLLNATPAMAHVVVKPNEVGVAAFQTFTIGVPVERDIPTTQLRLVIPEGLNYVTPNVKQGWTIDIKKSGEGETTRVTEITWSGGSIPAGQRDEFLFSAQVPAKETAIAWKAYQTYEDGEVVSWDSSEDDIEAYQKADVGKDTHDDPNAPKPYSQTQVINDLKAPVNDGGMVQGETANVWPIILSIAAFVMSAAALTLRVGKKK